MNQDYRYQQNNLTYNPNVIEEYNVPHTMQPPMHPPMGPPPQQIQPPMMQPPTMQPPMQPPTMQPPMMQPSTMNHRNMEQLGYKPKSKKVISNIENMDTTEVKKPSRFSFIRKLLIYTVLFIIFSHSKLTELLCGFVPYLDSFNSNIPCITLKGIIMSILIIIINMFVSL
jgi:hypothetical protein